NVLLKFFDRDAVRELGCRLHSAVFARFRELYDIAVFPGQWGFFEELQVGQCPLLNQLIDVLVYPLFACRVGTISAFAVVFKATTIEIGASNLSTFFVKIS